MLYNYLNNSIVEELSTNGKVILKVYNDSGGSLARGVPRVASPKWISGKGVVMTIAAPATEVTDANIVGLVLGGVDGTTSIADATYGFLQVAGPFGSVADGWGAATSGTVNANDQLEVLNTGTTLIDAGADGGAVLEAESIAIAIALVTTNVWEVFLIGKQSAIQAA